MTANDSRHPHKAEPQSRGFVAAVYYFSAFYFGWPTGRAATR